MNVEQQFTLRTRAVEESLRYVHTAYCTHSIHVHNVMKHSFMLLEL
jgi:hypothetical protein